jgi:hypothetical protein
MLTRLLPAAAIAAVLALAAGCGPDRLNESKSYTIEPMTGDGFVLPAQPKPQKITVEFNSSECEVTVLLFNYADAKDDQQALTADAKKALGHQKGKSGTFTADVPANTETRIVVRDGVKKTKVDLKVTNK